MMDDHSATMEVMNYGWGVGYIWDVIANQYNT